LRDFIPDAGTTQVADSRSPSSCRFAADMKSATFVYVDPGRHTDKELQRWAAEHRELEAAEPGTRNPAGRSRGLRRRVRGSDRRLHDRSRPRPRAGGSRM